MTRRERLERKLERRREWANKATGRSEASFAAVSRLADSIPLGQPLLIGHHSERHARRDAERIRNGMTKGVELSRLATHHEAKAGGIEHALARSVFSDDANAIEELETRIAKHEARRNQYKAINAAIRKHAKAGRDVQVAALCALGFAETTATMLLEPDFAGRIGIPSYELTNLGARIRTDKERIEEIKRRTARSDAANATTTGVLIEGGDYARVTFADKPSRETINALKAAGFYWQGGSWYGPRATLPTQVQTVLTAERED